MSNLTSPLNTDIGREPTPRSFTTGRYLLITALLLLFGGLIWMVVAFGAHDFKDVDAQRADQRYKIYDEVLQSNQKTLNDQASVINKEQGKIRVPLADAINLTLRDINANKPHAAYPVQQTNIPPNPSPPADPKTPSGEPQTNTQNANKPGLPKQPEAANQSASNGNLSPSPSPAQDQTKPR